MSSTNRLYVGFHAIRIRHAGSWLETRNMKLGFGGWMLDAKTFNMSNSSKTTRLMVDVTSLSDLLTACNLTNLPTWQLCSTEFIVNNSGDTRELICSNWSPKTHGNFRPIPGRRPTRHPRRHAFSPVLTSSCPAPSATAITMDPFRASVASTCASTSCWGELHRRWGNRWKLVPMLEFDDGSWC